MNFEGPVESSENERCQVGDDSYTQKSPMLRPGQECILEDFRGQERMSVLPPAGNDPAGAAAVGS